MEKQVIFRDRQELQSADLNNGQAYTAASLQHLRHFFCVWPITRTLINVQQAQPGTFGISGSIEFTQRFFCQIEQSELVFHDSFSTMQHEGYLPLF